MSAYEKLRHQVDAMFKSMLAGCTNIDFIGWQNGEGSDIGQEIEAVRKAVSESAIAPPVAAGSVDTESRKLAVKFDKEAREQRQRAEKAEADVLYLKKTYASLFDERTTLEQRAEKAETDLASMKSLVCRFWTGQYFDGVTKGDAAEINKALK